VGLCVAEVSPRKERQSHPELLPGILLLSTGMALAVVALLQHGPLPALKPLYFQLAGSTILAGGGLMTALFSAMARRRGARAKPAFVYVASLPLPRPLEIVRHRTFSAWARLRAIDWQNDWLPLGAITVFTLLALFALMKGWALGPIRASARDTWIIGALIGLAFPLLVLERRFAGLSMVHYPEIKSLTYLVRLVLVSFMGLALAGALRALALPFAESAEHTVLILNGLVALELLLRAASYIFMPLPVLAERRHAKSLIASILRLQRPSLKAIKASVGDQFGIDLGRSWALGYVRRAAVPLLGGMLISAWLLTGVVTLNLSERAVYEAFGSARSVLHSGLHILLPWPFGRLKPVELGVVHEIPIAFLDEEIYGKPTPEKAIAQKSSIEGRPPAGADRLWEASRPTEASYLVASNQNGRENFEVINIDLRVIYRIGLSDRAAMNAAYSVEMPENLIRAAAGRMLAQYFARYTLSAILGQDRERFIRSFQKELQGRLNTLSPSIDILGVVIETIHPPAGAAEAYQQVQAASIEAVTKVANARADAVRDVHQAEADATEARDGATAMAAETVAEAKVGTALFAGDAAAYRAGGPAFLFEKRLANLMGAIKPETPVTILDSRIPASQLQMLQFRPALQPPGGVQ
jgi:regulator of protease activity HflC (stomatin/prohibitin superfamily)